MNFKITRNKIIVAIIVTVIWYIFAVGVFIENSLCLSCAPCLPLGYVQPVCSKVFTLNILPETCNCNCGCPEATPPSKILSDLLVVLFPGIIIYLTYSLVQRNNL